MKEKKYKDLIKNKVSKFNLLKNFMNNNCNIDKLINGNTINNKKDDDDTVDNGKEVKDNEDKNDNESNTKNSNMFKKVEIKKNKNNERNYINKNKIIKEEDEKEKSLLPFEMSKKMNSFMDFSAILNDNSKLKESVIRKNISKIWGDDISAIVKNEDI